MLSQVSHDLGTARYDEEDKSWMLSPFDNPLQYGQIIDNGMICVIDGQELIHYEDGCHPQGSEVGDWYAQVCKC